MGEPHPCALQPLRAIESVSVHRLGDEASAPGSRRATKPEHRRAIRGAISAAPRNDSEAVRATGGTAPLRLLEHGRRLDWDGAMPTLRRGGRGGIRGEPGAPCGRPL